MLLCSHMIPLILPVISGEEDRGVWSSNKKQKKNLQVDQEGGFKQRSNILGFSPRRNKEMKSIQKGKTDPRSAQHFFIPGQEGEKQKPSSACQFCAEMQSDTQPDARRLNTDIKMTKTRRQAGDSGGAARVMCGKQKSGDEDTKTSKDQISLQILHVCVCEDPERSRSERRRKRFRCAPAVRGSKPKSVGGDLSSDKQTQLI